jgi:ABC-2 type transport system ATP-binding protein
VVAKQTQLQHRRILVTSTISVSQLSKHYKVPEREGGLKAAVTSLFNRKYKNIKAVDGISFTIEPGEVVGFLGPNGAGKTTTLKLLMQLIYPTAGHAEILERPIGDVAVKRRIGYLPESPYFYDYLTAEELLDYYASLFGYDRADRSRRVSALLDQVGIAAERRLPLRKFSKGMIQRVGIAQALINDPEVVFFDEPMSGLDPLGRREVRNLILSLRDRGCTVFFSSHVLSDAEALCNRVAVLAHGKLVASGSISDLQAFNIRGWELIVSGLTPELLERHRSRVQRVTPLGEHRYSFELPLEPAPEQLLRDLTSAGAQLVSLNPLRDTLEDFFVKKVTEQSSSRWVGTQAGSGS